MAALVIGSYCNAQSRTRRTADHRAIATANLVANGCSSRATNATTDGGIQR
jgi:hypothetical protein